MIWIISLAVVVIVFGYLPLTRDIIITGRRARIFGVLLLILTVPALALIDFVLKLALPQTLRASGSFSVIRLVLFSSLVVVAAFVYHAKTRASVRPPNPR